MPQVLLFVVLFSFGALRAQPTPSRTLYPNPTTGVVHLDDARGVASLEVYNLVGRRVQSFRVAAEKTYDLSALEPGMYLVRMLNERRRVLVTRRVQKR